jgi:hypothetical protein
MLMRNKIKLTTKAELQLQVDKVGQQVDSHGNIDTVTLRALTKRVKIAGKMFDRSKDVAMSLRLQIGVTLPALILLFIMPGLFIQNLGVAATYEGLAFSVGLSAASVCQQRFVGFAVLLNLKWLCHEIGPC